MLVMSNLYEMKSGSLTMSSQRQFKTTPLIKLGDEHFKVRTDFEKPSVTFFQKFAKFRDRFNTIPDMLEADHVTISGDVTFGKGVTLKGTVRA